MTLRVLNPRVQENVLHGRHVLMMILAFFAVVFAVNGYFLVAALSTHTGVVSVEPYRKGLAYNARISAGEAQTAMGWTDDLDVSLDGDVVLQMSDRAAAPVRGMVVSGTIGRPSTSQHDRVLHFEEDGRGRYVARTGALDTGSWIVGFEVRSGVSDAEPVYRMRRRLWLKH